MEDIEIEESVMMDVTEDMYVGSLHQDVIT